jgi:hypothetical protein
MFWIAVLSNQNGGLFICLALDNSKASTLSGKLLSYRRCGGRSSIG